MNKVVLIVGSVTVIVVGSLFFLAGVLTGTSRDSVSGKSEVSTESGITDKIKKSVSDFLDPENKKREHAKIEVFNASDDTKMIDEDDLTLLQNSSKSGVLFEKPSPNISVDSLLNEIIATHSTNDVCLTDNVKTENEENVVLNETKKNLVFIGYFPIETANQVSKLIMAKGYPSHVQISNATDAEAFVFCGPFKKESSASILVNWLKKHDFINAKVIKGSLLKAEKLDESLLNEGSEAIPMNLDSKKSNSKPVNKKNSKNIKKNAKKQKLARQDEDSEEIIEEEEPTKTKNVTSKSKKTQKPKVKSRKKMTNKKSTRDEVSEDETENTASVEIDDSQDDEKESETQKQAVKAKQRTENSKVEIIDDQEGEQQDSGNTTQTEIQQVAETEQTDETQQTNGNAQKSETAQIEEDSQTSEESTEDELELEE